MIPLRPLQSKEVAVLKSPISKGFCLTVFHRMEDAIQQAGTVKDKIFIIPFSSCRGNCGPLCELIESLEESEQYFSLMEATENVA